MQVSNTPLKWLYPWAQLSTTIFELPPTTTAGNGRACQSIGFPAETMLPPESGGVPPQGIDFNAGLFQVARITWWLMYGGGFVYDATFATNSAISGYAQGADISSSDYLGYWLNTVDNNQVNPDTTGTNWVPGYVYGRTTTALTNTNVTLTPLQAAKKILVFTGTLTGNVVVTLPAWVYEWNVLNQCSGAFTLTLTTSGGSGAVVPQGGSTKLRGDGTNINYDALNVPAASLVIGSTQALQAGQAIGRLLTVTTFLVSGTSTFTPNPLATKTRVRIAGGGGAGGGTQATSSSQAAAGSGGNTGNYAEFFVVGAISGTVSVTVGAGGTGVSGNSGNIGGTSSFGSYATIPGGNGGLVGGATSTFPSVQGAPTANTSSTLTGVNQLINAPGGLAFNGLTIGIGAAQTVGGRAGSNPLIGAAIGPSAGGQGAAAPASTAAQAGASGSSGLCIVEEFA